MAACGSGSCWRALSTLWQRRSDPQTWTKHLLVRCGGFGGTGGSEPGRPSGRRDYRHPRLATTALHRIHQLHVISFAMHVSLSGHPPPFCPTRCRSSSPGLLSPLASIRTQQAHHREAPAGTGLFVHSARPRADGPPADQTVLSPLDMSLRQRKTRTRSLARRWRRERTRTRRSDMTRIDTSCRIQSGIVRAQVVSCATHQKEQGHEG